MKKEYERKEVSEMKKVIKVVVVMILVVVLILCGVSLYIGNYFYDYTLNPKSTHNITDNIETNPQTVVEANQWLAQNSQEVSIQSYDDLKLHAYSVEQDSHVYVIMVHGYRGDGSTIIWPIRKMKNQGYNLLIPDLRGHGLSEGDYIGMGWDDREDILQWIDYILEKDQEASIILYGVSMGAATVMNVAGENPPSQVKAIIEDCGYTSVWDVFSTHLDLNDFENQIALHMASFVTKLRAGYYLEDDQPIEQIKKSQTPTLFIHGDQDQFVPFEMLDQLYNAATCEKQKLVIEGAGHANSCSVDSDLYYQTVFAFIENHIK